MLNVFTLRSCAKVSFSVGAVDVGKGMGDDMAKVVGIVGVDVLTNVGWSGVGTGCVAPLMTNNF